MKTLDLSQSGAVYIVCRYTDMRRGINGLVAQIQQQFRLNPRQQAVFLFCGRRSDRFKALFWDGDYDFLDMLAPWNPHVRELCK